MLGLNVNYFLLTFELNFDLESEFFFAFDVFWFFRKRFF